VLFWCLLAVAATLAIAKLPGNVGAQIRILGSRLGIRVVNHTSILANRAKVLARILDIEARERATAAVFLLGATNRTLRMGTRGY
tara:strand:+ start:652 stop:906 length:255 start_codon:yes stop_codon:yes gene_type:complete